MSFPRLLLSTCCLLLLAAASPAHAATSPPLPLVAKPTVNAPVTITDNGNTWTMDNGIVKAVVSKRNSNFTSLVYKGVEIVGHPECWEQTPSGRVTDAVTIDPATNGGMRGEVAVKGVNGRMDIEVRYALERGASGF